MVSGRKLIINWLIKSKAIKDNERELYEYALYSIVLLLSPAFISIAIGCIMGIPINGVLMVIPFLFLRKFSGGFHAIMKSNIGNYRNSGDFRFSAGYFCHRLDNSHLFGYNHKE